jgi:hypothetical protein
MSVAVAQQYLHRHGHVRENVSDRTLLYFEAAAGNSSVAWLYTLAAELNAGHPVLYLQPAFQPVSYPYPAHQS